MLGLQLAMQYSKEGLPVLWGLKEALPELLWRRVGAFSEIAVVPLALAV